MFFTVKQQDFLLTFIRQPLALVPLLYLSFWTMKYFRVHYAEASNRLTLERAMELDKQVAAVEASSSPRRRKSNSMMIPKDNFDGDHYKQPVLTEKHSEPLFYRVDREDELTVEARDKLGGGGDRIDRWNSENESDSKRRMREDGLIV